MVTSGKSKERCPPPSPSPSLKELLITASGELIQPNLSSEFRLNSMGWMRRYISGDSFE